jgi:hypothetical protein
MLGMKIPSYTGQVGSLFLTYSYVFTHTDKIIWADVIIFFSAIGLMAVIRYLRYTMVDRERFKIVSEVPWVVFCCGCVVFVVLMVLLTLTLVFDFSLRHPWVCFFCLFGFGRYVCSLSHPSTRFKAQLHNIALPDAFIVVILFTILCGAFRWNDKYGVAVIGSVRGVVCVVWINNYSQTLLWVQLCSASLLTKRHIYTHTRAHVCTYLHAYFCTQTCPVILLYAICRCLRDCHRLVPLIGVYSLKSGPLPSFTQF